MNVSKHLEKCGNLYSSLKQNAEPSRDTFDSMSLAFQVLLYHVYRNQHVGVETEIKPRWMRTRLEMSLVFESSSVLEKVATATVNVLCHSLSGYS